MRGRIAGEQATARQISLELNGSKRELATVKVAPSPPTRQLIDQAESERFRHAEAELSKAVISHREDLQKVEGAMRLEEGMRADVEELPWRRIRRCSSTTSRSR